MIRSALPLSLAAALGATACGTDPNNIGSRDPSPRASVQHAQPMPYRAGTGVVQSVTAAPRMASAGASTPPVTTTRSEPVASASSTGSSAGATTYHRLGIRMEDGRTQYVDMMGPDVPTVGTRVQLTPDHQIIRQ